MTFFVVQNYRRRWSRTNGCRNRSRQRRQRLHRHFERHQRCRIIQRRRTDSDRFGKRRQEETHNTVRIKLRTRALNGNYERNMNF